MKKNHLRLFGHEAERPVSGPMAALGFYRTLVNGATRTTDTLTQI